MALSSKAVASAPATTSQPTAAAAAPAASAEAYTFSNLDFTTPALASAQATIDPKTLAKMTKKKNRHALPKDANQALEVLAKKKQQLEGLTPEQREKREDKDRWEKVQLKAEGEKIRDDEKRLKKMAKRQERTKSKSAKAWSVARSRPTCDSQGRALVLTVFFGFFFF